MSSRPDQLILEEDARSMVRLLADVAIADGNHEQKKHLLMERLCSLVGGDFWVWGLAADYDPEAGPVYTAMISGGFSEEQVPKLLLALDNRELEDAMRPLGREIMTTGAQVTRLPSEYDLEDAFGQEDVNQLWREADISAPLVCYRPVANNSLSGIGIYRRFDRPAFTARMPGSQTSSCPKSSGCTSRAGRGNLRSKCRNFRIVAGWR